MCKNKRSFCVCVVLTFCSLIVMTEGIPVSVLENNFSKTSAIEGSPEFGKKENEPILTRAFQEYAKLWPKGIVSYEFEKGFPQEQKNKIMIAIHSISHATCIKFVPKLRKQRRNYVTFRNATQNGEPTCSSEIGLIGDPQDIVLTRNACDYGPTYAGSAVHEIMHALGFKHEFQRGDRDNYITFNRENAAGDPASFDMDYAVRPNDITYNVPFNFKSIMQYNPQYGVKIPGTYIFSEKRQDFVSYPFLKRNGDEKKMV